MERRYFTNWGYNRAILLNHLIDVVENNGGALVQRTGFRSYDKLYEIHNRQVYEKIREINEKIEWAKTAEKIFRRDHDERAEQQKMFIQKREEEKRKIREDMPIVYVSQFTSYVSFVYDGYYYYVEMDDNPLFEFHVIKAKLIDGHKYYETYLDDLDKHDWMYDCLFSENMNEAEFKEIANLLFNVLVKMSASEIAYEKKRKVCRYCGSRYGGYEKVLPRSQEIEVVERSEECGWKEKDTYGG